MTSTNKKKPAKKTLSSFLTESKIKKLAGDKYYERGEKYFLSGAVENLVHFENRISAHVWGHYKYGVYFWIEDNTFCYCCDCPVGGEGEFCKHSVASALEWINSNKSKSRKSCDLPDDISFDQVFKYLMNEDKDKLTRIIIKQTRSNPSLNRQLKLESSVFINGKFDIDFFKGEFHKALDNYHYDSDDFYEEDYFRDLHIIIDVLEELPMVYENEVNELARYMLTKIEEREMGGLGTDVLVEELIERLSDFCL